MRFAVLLPCLLASGLKAQSITVNSASIQINPQATDSYTIAGTFDSLAFDTSLNISLGVGQFSGTIPKASFVQQPGTHIFVYQDATGQSPYWVSSLTIDLDAQTFTAQASGVALAGLANPFTVQLASDSAAACSMVRVQQTSTGSYQLT